jgi:PHP family Zn ribbon phosphoesterase
MPKGITCKDHKEAVEVAANLRRRGCEVEIKRGFRNWIVLVKDTDLRAENYRRQLKGLPALEEELEISKGSAEDRKLEEKLTKKYGKAIKVLGRSE